MHKAVASTSISIHGCVLMDIITNVFGGQPHRRIPCGECSYFNIAHDSVELAFTAIVFESVKNTLSSYYGMQIVLHVSCLQQTFKPTLRCYYSLSTFKVVLQTL